MRRAIASARSLKPRPCSTSPDTGMRASPRRAPPRAGRRRTRPGRRSCRPRPCARRRPVTSRARARARHGGTSAGAAPRRAAARACRRPPRGAGGCRASSSPARRSWRRASRPAARRRPRQTLRRARASLLPRVVAFPDAGGRWAPGQGSARITVGGANVDGLLSLLPLTMLICYICNSNISTNPVDKLL